MNLVFHIVATAALLLLVFMLIRVQKDRELLRFLLKIVAGDKAAMKKIVVDWPLKYLAEFARTLEVPFQGEGSLKIGEPRKIDTHKLIQLYLKQGIRSITYAVDLQVSLEPRVTFLLGKEPTSQFQDVVDLEQALKVKCHVIYEK